VVTAVSDLVFMPGRGFMRAHALGTRSNVVVEREGMRFSGAVVPDRDGVRVIFTVTGFATDLQPGPYGFTSLPDAKAHVVDDQGRELASRPRWTTGGNLRFDGGPQLNWTLILEPPPPDARELTLTFDGPADDWTVRLPLEVIDHEGTPGRSIDVSDHRHGIRLAARALARTAEMTAVEIEAYIDPPSTAEGWARSYVMGIGASMHSGRLCGDQVILRDDRGTVHFECGRPIPEQTGGKQREVVLFPGLPADVRGGTIEVDLVWMHHGREEQTVVPVPGEAHITVGDCTGHVTVTRVPPREGAFAHLPDGPARSAVHIETKPADTEADRQLVFLAPTENQRVGMSVTHCIGQLPTVEIPETTEQLSAVTFRGGTIQVRGRWRLAIPLEI
jgi:hypothetical protein